MKLFHATVFEDFICIDVFDRMYGIAKQISGNKKWRENGMSGYDMRDFLENTLSDTLLDQVRMDPESGGFYCYIKPENKGELNLNDVHKTRKWMLAASSEIAMAHMRYIESLYNDDRDVPFNMEWTSEAKAKGLCDMVTITPVN